ncbi:MAG: ribonuclease III family protein [Candidatus Hadarchaeota archaeon]|nr:ribonuclease III family protein [Candidatus Hadarchaeota archaeon]
MKLAEILDRYPDHKAAFLDKKLAGFGDGLVNLMYSLALTQTKRQPVGAKVSNFVLAGALSAAGLRHFAPSRADRQRLADVVEAIVAYAWLRGVITLGATSRILMRDFTQRNLRDRKDLREGAKEGFTHLLTRIAGRLKLGRG